MRVIMIQAVLFLVSTPRYNICKITQTASESRRLFINKNQMIVWPTMKRNGNSRNRVSVAQTEPSYTHTHTYTRAHVQSHSLTHKHTHIHILTDTRTVTIAPAHSNMGRQRLNENNDRTDPSPTQTHESLKRHEMFGNPNAFSEYADHFTETNSRFWWIHHYPFRFEEKSTHINPKFSSVKFFGALRFWLFYALFAHSNSIKFFRFHSKLE